MHQNYCTQYIQYLVVLLSLGAGGPGFESLHSDHQKQAILLDNRLFLQLFRYIRSALSFSIPHLNQFHLMPFSVLFVYNHARFFALSTTLIIFYQIQLDHNYNHSSTSDYRLFNRDIMHRIHIGIPFSVHLWLLCRRMIQAYKVTFTPHKDRLA